MDLNKTRIGKGIASAGLATFGGVADVVGADGVAAQTQQIRSNIANPNVNFYGQPNPVAQVQDTGFTNNNLYAPQSTGGGGSGAYTGGVGGGQGSADDALYYSDQQAALQKLLGGVGGQEQQGLGGISDDYYNQLNRLNQQQSQALSGYATKRQDTMQDQQGALGQVDNSARNNYMNLQRLLGMSGAGRSSAAQILAPYAVSKQASQQRAGVQNTYGRNLRDLDTATQQTQQSYVNNANDLMGQKGRAERDFLSGLEEQRIGILQQLQEAAIQQRMAQGQSYGQARTAGQSYQGDIDARQSRLGELFNRYRQPQLSAGNVQVSTPELGQYTVDRGQVQAQQAGTPAEAGGYLPALLDYRKRQEDSFF